MNEVTVVGAGLAGCEAAWQLAQQGISVRLIEMKPERFSPAHRREGFAELVCSNSLKAEHLTNASGLLKAEMEKFGSLILAAAKRARVPAGTALAVDRDVFSREVTAALSAHPRVRIERRAASRIPEEPVIVATGPLTDPALMDDLAALPDLTALHFFDAAAPIVTAESLDMSRLFRQSRNDGGAGEYLNRPLDRAEYDAFYEALLSAELARSTTLKRIWCLRAAWRWRFWPPGAATRWPSGRCGRWGSSIRAPERRLAPWRSSGRKTRRARFTTWSAFKPGSSGGTEAGVFDAPGP
jgi:methylenetetrahydrofolate--tRNA-(uracil-5-)-methyltransferase